MNNSIALLLADDDPSDRYLFKKALDGLSLPVTLEEVQNGNELLNWLSGNETPVPDILFLDLNLPLNNGYACLAKIRLMEKLKNLPIVIYSHAFDPTTADALHGFGAHYYIRKPLDFILLKKLIWETIFQITAGDKTQPPLENFILNAS
jgi:CheY-like chemotaxis protein